MKYQNAKRYAYRIVELLSPFCERIDVAGSIRREKPEVGDIEIVCIPMREFLQTDLFGGGRYIVYPGFATTIDMIKKRVIKGTVDGRYMQMIIKGGEKFDLFMPQEHDYYRILAMRTGSAEFSEQVLAYTWVKKGWCGTPDGLRRIEDCMRSKSGGWICRNPAGEKPPVWKDEQEFFTWLGLDWVHPKLREVKQLLNAYR